MSDSPMFSEWLATHRDGELDQELSIAFRDVVAAVTTHEKKGLVVLKIVVDPNNGNVVILTPDVDAKIPVPARPKAIYFVDAEGYIHRTDPYQQRTPLDHPEATE